MFYPGVINTPMSCVRACVRARVVRENACVAFYGRVLRTADGVLKLFLLSFRSILADKTSRNLFFFLCLNLSFAFVELTYGIWSNR